MHTRTFGLVVGAALVAGLAGCSSGADSAPPPPAQPAPMAQAQPPAPPPQAQPMQQTPQPAAPQPGMSSRHQRVEALQTALNSNGAQLTVDGHMGPKTKAALIAFQKQHNLKATGRPDAETRKALGV